MLRIDLSNSVVFSMIFSVLLAGCAQPYGDNELHLQERYESEIELSEGEELRAITLTLEPGAIKRFRIKADQFVANLTQTASTQAKLSVKYYDLEFESQDEIDPTVYALASDEAMRNWTLRVHNEGTELLDARISVRALVRGTEEVQEPQLESLRDYAVELEPGQSLRRRVRSPNLVAVFTNDSENTRAHLRLKNYELEYEVEALSPVVETASTLEADRNWTVVLTNVSETQLQGDLAIYDRDTYRDFHEANRIPAVGASVLFSPDYYQDSHLPRIVTALDEAQETIDVAMYSMSDASTRRALGDAVARGVRVRVLFEGANADRRQSEGTRSHDLESMNVDVRYVNKILHHKYALIDGVESSLDIGSGLLISGSGNWSYGAAAIYDENTLFIRGDRHLLQTYQREFNLLWRYSRDFEGGAEGISIDSEEISVEPSQHESESVFTSDNFSVYNSSRYGWTFRSETGRNRVSNRLIDLIMNAEESISIASGHLRSHSITQALIAKAQTHPDIRIRVLLDGQEYVSESFNNTQRSRQASCLEEAGTSDSRRQKCYDVGYLYSYELFDAGLDVRFKYYAFRWDYSYAKQMHHKYLIIDDSIVATGSYNLSDNAEHNTFENVTILRGATYEAVVDAYVNNFDQLWHRGTSRFNTMIDELPTLDVIPLVFESMALSQPQIAQLKRLIADLCPDVWSDAFRSEPAAHQSCDVLSR